MRTTLDIADDVLFVAKDFARRDGKTVGQVVSELARKALLLPPAGTGSGLSGPESEHTQRLRQMGIAPLPRRGQTVTNEAVNALREQEGV
jgi:hypothetical protein